jgi:hypothetical protein
MSAPGRYLTVGDVAWGWKSIDGLVLEEAGVVMGERRSVLVPYRNLDGSLHNSRVFLPNGRCYWRTSNLELLPFGLEQLIGASPRTTAIVLAEGESDCLAIREAFAQVVDPDWPVRRYLVLGIPGAGTWKDEWRRYFLRFSLIYVVGDGDQAGRRMMDAVQRSIPWGRPLRLPDGEDARAILHRDGPRALDRFFDEADHVAALLVGFRECETLDELLAFMDRGELRGR